MLVSWEDYLFLSQSFFFFYFFVVLCVGQSPPGLPSIHLSVSTTVGQVQLMATQACL